jgi:hypothetical protein
VREIVGAAHTNRDQVAALLKERPALANATWDWGFGDWESPLGAASHMGRRDIAELLLASGARATIFSAAMLGQLEVVRAFVLANPGVQRTTGPHGLTLMQHAKAGGPGAAAVFSYLESIGGADERPLLVPLTESERSAIAGVYAFPAGGPRVEVDAPAGGPGITFAGGIRRFLAHTGGLRFTPGGVPSVTLDFKVVGERAQTLRLRDGSLELVATRV